MKIVDKIEAELLDKNTNVSIISEISENKYLVRYSGQINDNIRKLFSVDPLITNNNQTITYSKEQIKYNLKIIKIK